MKTPQDLDEVFVEELYLSPRISHALKRNGVFTVGKLKKLLQSKKLEHINNIGQKSLDKISVALDGLIKNSLEFKKVDRPPESFIGSFEGIGNKDIDSAPVEILDLRKIIKHSLIKNGIITVGDFK